MVGFKTSVVKHREKVDFLPHVVATTPQDRSSCCRISRYGKSSFPRMRTASFWTFLLLATVAEVIVAICLKCLRRTSPPLSLFQFFPCCFLAIFSPVSCLQAISLANKLSLHVTQSQLSVLSRYFYVTLNLVAVKTV